jgi:hypothetical protein
VATQVWELPLVKAKQELTDGNTVGLYVTLLLLSILKVIFG